MLIGLHIVKTEASSSVEVCGVGGVHHYKCNVGYLYIKCYVHISVRALHLSLGDSKFVCPTGTNISNTREANSFKCMGGRQTFIHSRGKGTFLIMSGVTGGSGDGEDVSEPNILARETRKLLTGAEF